MVHISLSPNLEKEDALAALRQLGSFWKRRKKTAQKELIHELKEYLGDTSDIYLFNSGRSALTTFLSSFHFKPDDEVILQAFTCNAVANAIRWAGAKPIYVDIDDSFTMDSKKLKRVITERTRAVIVQHTFGIPADINQICEIARAHNLIVIEDCAHALGVTYQGKPLGTFGDAAFFSFGRDKVISCVYGGALLIREKTLQPQINTLYQKIPYPRLDWVLQQLLHPLITLLALETYEWAGKYILYSAQKLHMVSYAVTQGERRGQKPSYIPARLPEALAYGALLQFKKLRRLNEHRIRLADIYETMLSSNSEFKLPRKYDPGTIFLRYPVLYDSAQTLITYLQERDIIIGDWYREVVAPAGTDFNVMDYTRGSCPEAEAKARSCLNLPTNIRTSEYHAKRIAELLLTYVHKRNSQPE